MASPVICREKLSENLLGVFYGRNPLKSSFPLFLLELSLLIVISHIVRILLKPLGQPKIISEVIVSEFWNLGLLYFVFYCDGFDDFGRLFVAHYVFVEMPVLFEIKIGFLFFGCD